MRGVLDESADEEEEEEEEEGKEEEEEEEIRRWIFAGGECFERRARELGEVRQGGIALTADESGVATERDARLR